MSKKNTKFECLEDRVIVRPIKKTEPETTEAGIITDTIRKDVCEGEVINVGAGFTARDTGVFIPTVLAKGDVVLFGVNSGMQLEVPNEDGGKDDCRLMREGDVLVLVKKSSENN